MAAVLSTWLQGLKHRHGATGVDHFLAQHVFFGTENGGASFCWNIFGHVLVMTELFPSISCKFYMNTFNKSVTCFTSDAHVSDKGCDMC